MLLSTRVLASFITLCVVAVISVHGSHAGEHHRVRRGNYGERNSGGLGAQGAYNGGGFHPNTGGGSRTIFDHIALNAISGPNNNFINSYQAGVNAQASQAGSFDYAQQQGQHSAAQAGLAANAVGQWYNAIATGHVSPSYKGEYRKRR